MVDEPQDEGQSHEKANFVDYMAIRVLSRVRQFVKQEETRLRKVGEERVADVYVRVLLFIENELQAEPNTVMAIAELRDQKLSAKPIGKRERRTLLIIIGALAEAAKIDISHPSKAAGIVEQCAQRLGARLPARTIEEHLKRVAEAVEERSE